MTNLTSKELSSITDQLNLENNLVAKYRVFATQTDDAVLKDKFNCIAQKHKAHYDALYALIQ